MVQGFAKKVRKTIRFNESEELKLKQLQEYVHEQDISKVLKFALNCSLAYIKNVTNMLVDPEYEVVFMKRRKSAELKRKVFE